jgi:hypothetical protein
LIYTGPSGACSARGLHKFAISFFQKKKDNAGPKEKERKKEGKEEDPTWLGKARDILYLNTYL